MEIANNQLIPLGRELLNRTKDWTAAGRLEVSSERMSNLAHAPIVHSLTRHALLTGEAALDLHEHGRHLAAMPLSRAAWEFGITAMWASDSQEASAAIHEYSRRQQRLLLECMQSWPDIPAHDVAEKIAQIYGDNLETSVSNQASNFWARCDALANVGEQGYSIYRAMSGYCHPSSLLIDQYMQADDGPVGVKLRQEPTPMDGHPWVFLTVAAMVWGARAFDVMTMDHPHRNYLGKVARDLGLGVDIARLSDAAHASEAIARQARRRAQWKTPKKRRRRQKLPGKHEHGVDS